MLPSTYSNHLKLNNTMTKSDSIKHLAIALNKAQAVMSGAKKSAANPFFKSKYANLEEVIACIKEPFESNGLSFMQFPICEDDRAGVETIVMHESGEWISGSFMLKCTKLDPQGMASAITYARRYGIQSIAGIPSDCLLYTSPSPRDRQRSRMPSSA